MKKTRQTLLTAGIFFIFMVITNRSAYAKVDTEIELNVGYRHDNLNWNIAGTNINVLSELKWEDLSIVETKLKAKLLIDEGIYLKLALGFGWILDGHNRDSDYNGQDRSLEYSRSNNNADRGYVFDVSIAGGYQFVVIDKELFITPLFGLAYNSQYLRMTDGYQSIPATGSFDGLDSSYNTHWFSAWIGFDAVYQIGIFSFLLGFEFHGVYYYAAADWNLRDDFKHPVSFAHYAPGIGFDTNLTIAVSVAENWLLNIDYHFRYYFTFEGTDQTYMADGTISNTILNRVNWWSHKISLGVSYQF